MSEFVFEDMTFDDVMALINEEPSDLTRKGLDIMHSLMEHLALGGTLDDFQGLQREESIILLGIALRSATAEVNYADFGDVQ